MTAPDQAAGANSGPAAEPAVSPPHESDADAPDRLAAAPDLPAQDAPARPSWEPLSTPPSGGALGLSTRQTQLLGLAAALVAGGCSVVLIRNRIRQRARQTAMRRLQDRAYLSASRLITSAVFMVGPLRHHGGTAGDRLGQLLIEAILRRKVGATPLLLQRASQALPQRKRN